LLIQRATFQVAQFAHPLKVVAVMSFRLV